MIDAPVELAPCAETQMLMEETAKPTAKDSKDSKDPVIGIISMTSMFDWRNEKIQWHQHRLWIRNEMFELQRFHLDDFHRFSHSQSDDLWWGYKHPRATYGPMGARVQRRQALWQIFRNLLLISDSIYDIFMTYLWHIYEIFMIFCHLSISVDFCRFLRGDITLLGPLDLDPSYNQARHGKARHGTAASLPFELGARPRE